MNANTERSSEEQHRLSLAVTDLFEQRICFNAYLGLKVRELWADSVSVSFEMKPEFVGHFLYGRLHGGVIASVLDTTGGLAVMAGIAKTHSAESSDEIMQRFKFLGTLDMRVDYLRPGVGTHFTADAEIVRLGGRVAVTRMSIVNDEASLIATGNAAFIVSG